MPNLQVEPTGWASWNARIISEGAEVTVLSISLFKSRGRFRLEGKDYTIRPRGFWLTNAELRQGSTVIAKVRKPSVLRRQFEITSAGHRLQLESRSLMGREYVLRLNGEEVGVIDRKGMTGRKMTLEFPEEVPLVIQVFLVYVVMVQVKREAAVAASGS